MVDGFSPSAPCPGNKSVGSLLHTEGGYPPRVLLTLLSTLTSLNHVSLLVRAVAEITGVFT